MASKASKVNPADLSPAERATVAQSERETLTAWQAKGSGTRPSTPVLDYLAVAPEQQRTRKVGTAKGVLPADPAVTHAYWIGSPGSGVADRLVAVTQHHMSYMSGYTAVRGSGIPAVGTKALEALLRDKGVTDIDHTEWELLLPNVDRLVGHYPIPGRTLPDGRVILDGDAPNRGKVPAVKAPAKRTRKAPAKAPAAKAPAGSRPAKRAAKVAAETAADSAA